MSDQFFYLQLKFTPNIGHTRSPDERELVVEAAALRRQENGKGSGGSFNCHVSNEFDLLQPKLPSSTLGHGEYCRAPPFGFGGFFLLPFTVIVSLAVVITPIISVVVAPTPVAPIVAVAVVVPAIIAIRVRVGISVVADIGITVVRS